jgi:mannose-6-phosphate isomerase-like protein (cupin superfamily)
MQTTENPITSNQVLSKKEGTMQSRFYAIWKIYMIGLISIAILLPCAALAQGQGPEYKIFKTGDLLSMANPAPKERLRVEILTDKDRAKLLGGIFIVVPPTAANAAVHYHNNRESLLLIQSGEGVEIVEGKKIPVKAGDCIYIPPMVKHAIWNTSDKDLKYMEFYTPTVADVVNVKE